MPRQVPLSRFPSANADTGCPVLSWTTSLSGARTLFVPALCFLLAVPGGDDAARLADCGLSKDFGEWGKAAGLLSYPPMMSDARTLMVDLHLEVGAGGVPQVPTGGVVHALRVYACFSLCRAVGPPHRHVTGSRSRSARDPATQVVARRSSAAREKMTKNYHICDECVS
jgi:hypothetical protein